MDIKEFVKEYNQLLSNDSPFIYVDQDGKRYKSAEEVYKSGKQVTIKNTNDAAVDGLKGLGIDSKSDATKFMELLNHIFGLEASKNSSGRTRKTYTEGEKASLMGSWAKADAEGISKVNFCKDNDITYQTLMKWIRESK